MGRWAAEVVGADGAEMVGDAATAAEAAEGRADETSEGEQQEEEEGIGVGCDRGEAGTPQRTATGAPAEGVSEYIVVPYNFRIEGGGVGPRDVRSAGRSRRRSGA